MVDILRCFSTLFWSFLCSNSSRKLVKYYISEKVEGSAWNIATTYGIWIRVTVYCVTFGEDLKCERHGGWSTG